MFILINFLFLGFVKPGIEISPSYAVWEGWYANGANCGVIMRTAFKPLNFGGSFTFGMQEFRSGDSKVSFKSVGLDLGLEYAYKMLSAGGGVHCGNAFSWNSGGCGLAGAVGLPGYYGKVSLTVFRNEKFSVSTGASYHTYTSLRDFMQLRGNIDVMFGAPDSDFSGFGSRTSGFGGGWGNKRPTTASYIAEGISGGLVGSLFALYTAMGLFFGVVGGMDGRALALMLLGGGSLCILGTSSAVAITGKLMRQDGSFKRANLFSISALGIGLVSTLVAYNSGVDDRVVAGLAVGSFVAIPIGSVIGYNFK